MSFLPEENPQQTFLSENENWEACHKSYLPCKLYNIKVLTKIFNTNRKFTHGDSKLVVKWHSALVQYFHVYIILWILQSRMLTCQSVLSIFRAGGGGDIIHGTPSPGISNNERKRNLVKKITVWHPCPFVPLEKWLPCPFHCATVECRNLESNLVNFRMSRMWYCKIINHQGKLCEKDARSYALLFSICKIQHFII